MKRLISFLFIFSLLLCGCAGGERAVDLDLIVSDIISPAMAYAEAANMVANPKDYLNQTIQAEGCIMEMADSNTGELVHVIEIADTKGCCSEYLEINLAEGLEYPDEDTIMYVYGIWTTYEQDGETYYRIEADRMELSVYETGGFEE